MLLRGSAYAFMSLIAACGSSPPKGDPTAPTSAVPSQPTGTSTPPASTEPAPSASPASGSTPAALLGRWTSPKCGSRTYVRNLEILEGGRFTAEDRVSPCPLGAQCVWSGIVDRKGNWTVDGTKLELATDKDRLPPKQGAPWPGSLELADGQLVEVQGAERCVYTRP